MLLLGKHGYRKTRKHRETEPDDYIPFREREEKILTLGTNNGTSSFIDLIMPMRQQGLMEGLGMENDFFQGHYKRLEGL